MLQSRLNPISSSALTNTDIDVQEDSNDSPEDIFGSFLPHLLPDDAPSFHGDPGEHLLYASPRYGNITIMVPSYPDSKTPEESTSAKRMLFAHFLWSAGLVIADRIECAHGSEDNVWSMQGQKVLELGAGAALPSIISALANASSVTATDHPSSPAFTGSMKFNIEKNLSKRTPPLNDIVSPHPHEWGCLEDDFSIQNKGSFGRILAADCFWMRGQLQNLSRTMEWFLAPEGRVLIVSGFHTGRAVVAEFFEKALEQGLVIESIYEKDLMASGDSRREWMPVREERDQSRWCVVAALKRK